MPAVLPVAVAVAVAVPVVTHATAGAPGVR